jgi:dTDP-4-amino-4,6-dideoxygalactose transaminase
MEHTDVVFPEPLHVGRPNIGDRTTFLRLVEESLDRRWLTNDGPLVREFEARIADYVGVKHCVAMVNGTIALEIAIRALGLTGEVIVPSFTFVATAHALRWQGLTPVFADIDSESHTLDVNAVRARITPRTTGIIAVHLWGRPADVAGLEALAKEHGLSLLFDAAHAFGTGIGSRMIGSFGRAEVYSFHATKFFNSLEGGAIVTDDDEVASRARLMRNFGFAGEDTVVMDGTNGKMTEICAAMGIANLGAINDVIAINERNYHAYVDKLEGVPGIRILPIEGGGPRNFQYVVMLVDETCPVSRDDVLARLRKANVLARRYFWPGVHRVEPYRTLEPEAGLALPTTERIANQVIVLPTGSAVDVEAVETIAGLVRAAVESA